LSEDPKEDIDSPNLHAFVGRQPHIGTDPLGQACPECPKPVGNPAAEREFTEGLIEAGKGAWGIISGCIRGAFQGAEDDYGQEKYLFGGCKEGSIGQLFRNRIAQARDDGASDPVKEGVAIASLDIAFITPFVELKEGEEVYVGPIHPNRTGGRIVGGVAIGAAMSRALSGAPPRTRFSLNLKQSELFSGMDYLSEGIRRVQASKDAHPGLRDAVASGNAGVVDSVTGGPLMSWNEFLHHYRGEGAASTTTAMSPYYRVYKATGIRPRASSEINPVKPKPNSLEAEAAKVYGDQAKLQTTAGTATSPLDVINVLVQAWKKSRRNKK
jgi:hypothetical protein